MSSLMVINALFSEHVAKIDSMRLTIILSLFRFIQCTPLLRMREKSADPSILLSWYEGAMKRVAVVGAGAAGLCCARHLSRHPDRFQFSVFEQASEVGGTWVYEKREERPRDVREERGRQSEGSLPMHSSMYKNLR